MTVIAFNSKDLLVQVVLFCFYDNDLIGLKEELDLNMKETIKELRRLN